MSAALQALATAVLAGELPATARACRLVDDGAAEARELLSQLYPASGKAWRLGITGTPGAGKSTLVTGLIKLLRVRGERVGVVAVDPTSPYTGGALLGDRIRMQEHAEDPEVFIRSLASRGAKGGISRTTLDVTRVLEAWGAQTVIVETVGVGQTEVDVMRAVDTLLIVMPPGQGDHVQAAKAGLLEVADVFAVNKADQPGADIAVTELQSMIALGEQVRAQPVQGAPHHGHAAHASASPVTPTSTDRWLPSVLKTVAITAEGLPELLTALEQHRAWLNSAPAGQARRRERLRWELVERARAALVETLLGELGSEIAALVDELERGQGDPYGASDGLLQRFRAKKR